MYEDAMKQGDIAAICNLGRCYLQGQGVQRNRPLGVKLLRKSARKGFSIAAAELASAYADGKYVSKDLRESVRWLKVGARLGDGVMARSLALALEHGRGTKRSEMLAFRWMQIAADLGEPHAWRPWLVLPYWHRDRIRSKECIEVVQKGLRTWRSC